MEGDVNFKESFGQPRPSGNQLTVLGGAEEFSVASVLRGCGLTVAEGEAAPKQVSDQLALRYGYRFASVRAGRLGHPSLIRQVVEQAVTGTLPKHALWKQRDGTIVDGQRAGVDPVGLPGRTAAEKFRREHLAALRGLLVETKLLVLPLWTITGLVDPADGTVYPYPPHGTSAPRTARLAERQSSVPELDAAFAAMHGALKAVNSGIRLCILVLPRSISLNDCQTGATLRALATGWQSRFADVTNDPVLDHLLLRLASLSKEETGALGPLVAGLLQGGRLEDLIASGPADTAARQREDRATRRERRQNRQKRRATTSDRTVICEDELLEAFS